MGARTRAADVSRERTEGAILIMETETKRIYISGPMSGLPEHNFPAFEAAAKALRARGHEVVSPHEVDTLPSLGTGDKDAIWRAYMREDIALLVRCQKVVRLPGWEKSRGAMLEVLIAENLKMEIEDYELPQNI